MTKTWTPEQFWEYVEGLTNAYVRDQMREMLSECGLSILPQSPAVGTFHQIAHDEGKPDLAALWQAVIDNTKGSGFWLGETLLTTIERETGFNGAVSRPGGIETKDSDWMLREAGWHRLVMDAYNEGFREGMREHTSHKGGQPWGGSKAQKKMNELARLPQESADGN